MTYTPPPTGTKISQKHIIAIGVAIAAVFLVAYIVLSSNQALNVGSPATTAPTVITGLNIQVQYVNPSETYLGPTSQAVAIGNTPNQILEVNKGQRFFISFSLSESYLADADHSVDEITILTPGFSIISVDPTTPIMLSPGATTRLTITFQAPTTAFTGAVNVSLSTK